MTFIPRYTQNVQAQVGPLVDASPIYNALATVFGKVEKTGEVIGQQKADQAAKVAGIEAGLEPGFKPVTAVGKAAQIYNETGLQAQKLTLGAEIGVKLSELYTEAARDPSPTSIAHFNAALQGYGESVLNNTPTENKPYIKALLLQHGTAELQKLQTKLKDRTDIFAYAKGMETISSWQKQAENAAVNGNQAAALTYNAQAQKTAAGMASMGLMSKGTYSSFEIQNRKQVLTADMMGQYQKAAEQGKGQEFMKSVLQSTAYDGILSPLDKQTVVNQMQGLEKTKLQADGITAETIANKKKNVIYQAQNGIAPNPSDIAAINAYDPTNAQNLQNDISLAGYQHSVVQNAVSGSAGEMMQTVEHLNKVSPDELKSEEAAKISLANKGAAQQIEQHMTLLKKDPMQAIQANSNYQNITGAALQEVPAEQQPAVSTFIKTGQIPTTPEGVQAVQSFIQNSAPSVLALQKTQGVPDNKLSLVTNGQAAQMVGQMSQLPMSTQVTYLNDMQQLYGENIQQVLPALAKAGLPIANQLILRASSDPSSLSYVPAMVAANSTPTKQLEAALPAAIKPNDVMKAVKNDLSQYNSTLYGYNGAPGPVIAEMEKQAYQLTLQFISQGQNASNAAQNATDALINKHYQFSSFNGQTYRIPNNTGASNDVIKAAINYNQNKMNSEPLQVPNHFYPQLPADKRQALYLSDSVQSGFLVTNPDDSGLTFVDRFGVPVKAADGKPFAIKFNELNSFITSPEYQKESAAMLLQQAKEREAAISSVATGAYSYASLPTQ